MGYFERAADLRKQYDMGKIKRYAGEQIKSDPGYAQYAQESNRAYDAARRRRRENLGARGLLGSGAELRGEQVASQDQASQMAQVKAQRMFQIVADKKNEIMTQLQLNENEYKRLLEKLAIEAGMQEYELNKNTNDYGSRIGQGVASAVTGIAGRIARGGKSSGSSGGYYGNRD
jgi:hypothetical protein